MAKAGKPKAKPSRKDQFERFQQTARDLGIDDKEGAEAFERAFTKIVPSRGGGKPIGKPPDKRARR